ncbi:MAG: glycosyltransferase [Anaerolineaceae bacterium]
MCRYSHVSGGGSNSSSHSVAYSWVWKIIVVDDASPDDSAKNAQELRDNRVIILRHAQNSGVGGAMLTGFKEAARLGATILVKMDGDGQMSVDYLSDLVRPIRISGQIM